MEWKQENDKKWLGTIGGCTSDQTLGKAMEREWKGNEWIR